MTEKKKLDAGNILTKNSIETDNQDIIYDSLHKLRRYLINVDSVKEFHQAGGIGNLIILYKKYSVILISLHTKKSTKNNGDSKIGPKLNKIVHESLGLLANCCHFDKNCKLAIKNTQLLSNLVPLLQMDKICLEIVSSVARLLGNLCDLKETAACVLQTKSLINCVVHWMIKKFDVENITTMKIRDFSLRIFRSASSCSSSFARFLLQNDVAFNVANFFASDFCSIALPSDTKSNVLRTLTELASCKDGNFAEQFIRAGVTEEIMKIASGDDESGEKSNQELCKLARKLLFDCIRDFSDLRIEFSKYGAVELIHKLARFDTKTMILLSKFCRDAFTRQKLRETDGLNSLLDSFGDDERFDLESKNELMNGFICLLYDDAGLQYALKRPVLMKTLAEILKNYCDSRRCTAQHSVAGVADDSAMDTDQLTMDADQRTVEDDPRKYRPDSPSYVRLKRPLDLDSNESAPLCKDFQILPSSPQAWQSPSSSPGRSWSPTDSVPGSPDCSRSPAWSLDSHEFSGSSTFMTDHLDVEEPFFSQSEWFEDQKSTPTEPKLIYSKCLCCCGWTPSTKDELTVENLTNSVVLFLSWLSHSDNFADILISTEENILEVIVRYVGTVCRPQPRAGRLLKRLARNRFLTEKLLKMQFHQTIRQILWISKCTKKPFCVHCRKLSRIGCDINLSFSAQVDSDFGFGILAHEVLTGTEMERMNSFWAVPYLIKTVGRRKRLLLEYGGLEQILNVFFNDSEELPICKSFECLRELITLRRLKELWTSECNRQEFLQETECLMIADPSTSITFVSSDKRRKVDARKKILVENSSFYRAMFAGQFAESSKSLIETKYDSDSFQAFEIFLHFLHGCRSCSICLTVKNWQQVSDLLSLSDQHFRYDLYEFTVKNFVRKFLTKSSLDSFLVSSALREDQRFFEICIIFVFLFSCPSEFCDFLTHFKENCRFLLIFKSMLTKFLVKFI